MRNFVCSSPLLFYLLFKAQKKGERIVCVTVLKGQFLRSLVRNMNSSRYACATVNIVMSAFWVFYYFLIFFIIVTQTVGRTDPVSTTTEVACGPCSGNLVVRKIEIKERKNKSTPTKKNMEKINHDFALPIMALMNFQF
jgi:hypothetical protein